MGMFQLSRNEALVSGQFIVPYDAARESILQSCIARENRLLLPEVIVGTGVTLGGFPPGTEDVKAVCSEISVNWVFGIDSWKV